VSDGERGRRRGKEKKGKKGGEEVGSDGEDKAKVKLQKEGGVRKGYGYRKGWEM
jgi:hypothetical protein